MQSFTGLTLYYSIWSPACRTVLLTLKYLGITQNVRKQNLDICEEYDNLHPWFQPAINKRRDKIVPTLVDNQLVIWESRSIAKYLVSKYATGTQQNLYPSAIDQQVAVDRLLYFDKGKFALSVKNYFKPQALYNEPPDPVLGGEVEQSLQILDNIVSRGHYALSGAGGKDHMTIADFCFLSTLSHLESIDYSYDAYKHVQRYAEFLKDRLPFYLECCQEGVTLMRDWARSNFKYLPRYLAHPSVPYDDRHLVETRI